MFRRILVAFLVGLGAGGIAHADCALPATDAERVQCIGQELLASDKTINDEYGRLHELLNAQGQADLRHQEIMWIKARASACQIDLKEHDREKWLADVMRDYSRTVCVVRFTDRRVSELRAQIAALADASQPASPGLPATAPAGGPAALPALDTRAADADVYDLVAQRQVTTGKWYFEVTMQVGEMAQTSAASIFIGAQGLGFSNVGTLVTVRRHDLGTGPRSIGVALDLDDGKLYLRVNGAWQALPGSATGLDLKLGRPYVAKLSSSVSLTPYLDRSMVDMNLGQHAFTYAVPDGYSPLDQTAPRRIVDPT
jgi:uncharacterized protein YecT (DUF1311 family)